MCGMIVRSKRLVLASPSVDRVCGARTWSGVAMLVLALAILLQLSLRHHFSAMAALLPGALDRGPCGPCSVSKSDTGARERHGHRLCGLPAGEHKRDQFEGV